MNKIKYYLLGTTFFVLFLGIALVLIKPVKAQTTTFPVEEAGIAAYVKLDSVDITDLTEALNFFDGDRRQGETYVIGQMKIENGMLRLVPHYSYPHLYIGLDGWIVAYYLKGEEVSRIMQWKGYTPGTITTTTLKDAIDTMCANIGVTYSTNVKYYDFEFPDANKMTIIIEGLQDCIESCIRTNSFSLTIPGTLHEASYSVYYGGYYYWWNVRLTVDETVVFSDGCDCEDRKLEYGYYDPSLLKVNIPHLITLSYPGGRYVLSTNAATVLIYQK